MADSFYKRAYKEAQKELTDLVTQQEEIERRILMLRQTVSNLQALCESKKIEIMPSPGDEYIVEYLLTKSTLPDEIVTILRAYWPAWNRPSEVRNELEKLGYDMARYTNPLATITMVLKRLVEAGKVQEMVHTEQGYKMYRAPRLSSLAEEHTVHQTKGGSGIIDKNAVRHALLASERMQKNRK